MESRLMAPDARPAGHVRWWILGLLVAIHCLNYIDRYTLALLAPQLSHDIGWSELDYGRIVVAFQLSYAFSIVIGGWVVDRIGTRLGVGLSLTMWSLAQMAHVLPTTAQGFAIARIALAMGEAAGFAGLLKAMNEWFPDRERGSASGIVLAAVQGASLVGPVLIPVISMGWGWHGAFLSTGLLGLSFVVPWMLLFRRPDEHSSVTEAERTYILDGRSTGKRAPAPWSRLLRTRQLWAYTLAAILAQPVSWFIAYWLPKYLATVHHVTGLAASPYLVLVSIMSAAGALLGGTGSSLLVRRGWSGPDARRRVMLLTSFVMPVVVLAAVALGPWSAAVLIGLAAGGYHCWGANNMALVGDLIPSRAIGAAVGFGNLLASLTGVLTAELTGRILQAAPGFYLPMFAYCAFVYLIAYFLISALIRGRGRADLG